MYVLCYRNPIKSNPPSEGLKNGGMWKYYLKGVGDRHPSTVSITVTGALGINLCFSHKKYGMP